MPQFTRTQWTACGVTLRLYIVICNGTSDGLLSTWYYSRRVVPVRAFANARKPKTCKQSKFFFLLNLPPSYF
uniref:Uncharacterized protein n=1 Tax=Octopus bimaculoides TaxID=37653 RepID=A0A0L8FUK2_OCTBM